MMPQDIILIFFYIISIIFQTNGFSLKMIPIDSPHLQVFPNTLTSEDRYEFLANITTSRALNVLNRETILNPNSIQTKLYRFESSYYATQLKLGGGEGEYAPYVLIDTGSSYTWVQCEGCSPCFELAAKNFRFTLSTTFSRMDIHDPRCVTQQSFSYSCGFLARYPEGSVRGLLANERFSFKITNHENLLMNFDNVVFGCALQNHNIRFGANLAHPNLIAGILGLGLRGPESFVGQLDVAIKGKFSYCITSMSESQRGVSTMYFGDDVQFSEDEQNRLKSVLMHVSQLYHLYVNGISVDGKRLPIDPSVFELDEVTYNKGFFVDSGAPYTLLAASAYDLLHEAMKKYFYDNYGWRPRAYGPRGFKLCYGSYPSGNQRFPSVVFHFRFNARHGDDVDMVMDPNNMFEKLLNAEAFCMMVYRNDHGPNFSLLGAFQQANFKLLYDLKDELFSFVPTKCQED